MTASIRVSTSAWPVAPSADWLAFAAKVDTIAREAASHGSRLLVLPEYASMELSSLLTGPAQHDLAAQLEAMQDLLPEWLELYAAIAKSHGLYVLAPSFPECDPDRRYRNRARLFSPAGECAAQDKLNMTRFEAETWGIAPGKSLKLFDTDLGRLGVAICYDSEFPLLVRRLAEAGADVVLVPACTDGLSGYHRVRTAGLARALENQCYVVQAATVGDAPWSPAIDFNVGAAGIFAPADKALSPDGVIALGGINRAGLIHAELDLDLMDELRRDGEVLISRDWRAAEGTPAGEVEIVRL